VSTQPAILDEDLPVECHFRGPPSRGPGASPHALCRGGKERWFEERWQAAGAPPSAGTGGALTMPPPSAAAASAKQTPLSPVAAQRRATSRRPQPEAGRQEALRASFPREAHEIQTAIDRMLRWTMSAKVNDFSRDLVGQPKQLVDAYESSGINMLPRLGPQDFGPLDDEGAGSDEAVTAIVVEMACAIAQLNFIRWLCGLPPVCASKARSEVCRVLSSLLVPRTSDPMARLGRPSELANAVQGLLSQRPRLSVMHGEVSLVVAIEKSLAATHLTTAAGAVATTGGAERQVALARALAASMDAPMPVHKEDKGRERSWARVRAEPPSSMIAMGDLPPALRHLEVLWHVQKEPVGGSSRSAARAASSLATVASEAIKVTNEVGAAAAGSHLEAPVSPSSMSMAPASSPRPPSKDLVVKRRHAKDTGGGKTRAISEAASPPKLLRDDSGPAAFGLCPVWGDRRGAVLFRRCLLSRGLRRFGAARQHDTCVLWTDAAEDLSGDEVDHESRGVAEGAAGVAHREAVCYPPTGIVPLYLLEGGRAPWTIMPDGTRFQPTSATMVEVWRVKIERPLGGDWSAERLSEVAVKGFAIDCSTEGEPEFCVIFWPDVVAQGVSVGDQLEVRLGGLRGPTEALTFFYEFASFLKFDLDAAFVAEAASQRAMLGESTLWGPPTLAPCGTKAQQTSGKEFHSQRSGLRGHGGNNNEANATKQPMRIEMLSHTSKSIVTNNVDFKLTVRIEAAAAVATELWVMRFGEEEECVANGVQVQRLQDSVYIVRAKLPMARSRYEIRFRVSEEEDPTDFQLHPFRFFIATGEQCQTLLSSLEDPLRKLFGLARVSTQAQRYGVYILAPALHRMLIGTSYFLVYVDHAVALARAREEAQRIAEGRPSLDGGAGALRMAPSGSMSIGRQRQQLAPPTSGPATTTLFSHRLLPAGGRGRSVGSVPAELVEIQESLRGLIEHRTQDSSGEVHLDLMASSGERLRQLRRRDDFPCFHEALVTFQDLEVSKKLYLYLRVPKVHVGDFVAELMCEWQICRPEHFPIGF